LQEEIFSLFHKESSQRSWVHPVSNSVVIGVLSPGLKRPGRGISRSVSSNTKVKNEWSYTSTFPTCVDKENSTFIPLQSSWVVGVLLQAPLFCVILGFRRGVDEICTLLGFYAAWTFKMGSVGYAETSV
jgi:hypothetical protein